MEKVTYYKTKEMANEEHIDSLEQAKRLAQSHANEIEQSLLKLKQEAAAKIQEIDDALTLARQIEQTQKTSIPSSPVQEPASKPIEEPVAETVITAVQEPIFTIIEEPVKKPVEAPINNTIDTPISKPVQEPVNVKPAPAEPKPAPATTKKAVEEKKEKKEDEKERIERLLKSRENEKQQIAELKKNLEQRTKGDKPAEPGNTGIKHTNAEVFIYVVDDNPLQLKVLLEKFKTTKSFKIAKGFASGDACLQYIKKHKYPKNSMIMAVVDYYLDDKGNGEESNTGIDVLHMLKDYDSDIEIIVLSGSDDVDIAASATHFGAISFVKKGEDDFKKIVNNIVWAIHEKAKVRKVAETQHMIKNLAIGIGVFSLLSFAIYFIYLYLDSKK